MCRIETSDIDPARQPDEPNPDGPNISPDVPELDDTDAQPCGAHPPAGAPCPARPDARPRAGRSDHPRRPRCDLSVTVELGRVPQL
jgi:hypothetical protein